MSTHLYVIQFLSPFFFNDTATTEIYTLSLHDALPISAENAGELWALRRCLFPSPLGPGRSGRDRKSTRLNSSHTVISYAVFCLKKKKKSSDVRGYRAVERNTATSRDYPSMTSTSLIRR